MLSSNRYQSNLITGNTANTADSNNPTGNVIELNSTNSDQHTHYIPTNGSTVIAGSGNNSVINSNQLFHSHHNMGHFTPSAAFISGTG